MSKQGADVKEMLSPAQYELAKTLYFQWLRSAGDLLKLPGSPSRKQSPRKVKKTEGSGKLFRGKALLEDDEGGPRAAQLLC